MKNIRIALVDYGVGNLASLRHTLLGIGYESTITSEVRHLDGADLIILPGVGAFASAMNALNDLGLVEYLQEYARHDRPLIGICLGMQLLTSASHEHHYTPGLDLIPGEVVPLPPPGWHIGWNALESAQHGVVPPRGENELYYFNHAFAYAGPREFQVSVCRHYTSIPAVIRRGNVVGLQFHPEKSQGAGASMIDWLIAEVVCA